MKKLLLLFALLAAPLLAQNAGNAPVTKKTVGNFINEDLVFGSGRTLDLSAATVAFANNQITIAKINGLQAALDLKATLADPAFTGTVVLPSTTSIGTVSSTELGYVDGVTSAIQTQLNTNATAISTEATARDAAIVTERTATRTITGATINGASNTLTVRLASDVTGTLPAGNMTAATSSTAGTVPGIGGTTTTNAATIAQIPLQAETADYYARILAAGATIDAARLAALDDLIAGVKRVGYYSKLPQIMTFGGNSLAASFVKFKGAGAITNNNFVEADYDPLIGIYPGSTNSSKYLDLGFDLASIGASVTNVSAVYATTPSGRNDFRETGNVGGIAFGALAANMPASADSNFGLNMNQAVAVGSFSSGGCNAGNIIAITAGSSGVTMFQNGVIYSVATGAATGTFSGNINSFRCRLGGSIYWTNLPLSFLAIGTELTTSEAKDLSERVYKYLRAVGRIPQKPRYMAMGDSISQGSDASTYNGNFTFIFANRCGYVYNNVAKSGALSIAGTGFASAPTVAADVALWKPDIVTLALGTNDSRIGNDPTTDGDPVKVAAMKTALGTACDTLIAEGVKVIGVGLPYNPEINATKSDLYITAQADAYVSRGLPFVDVYSAMMDTGSPSTYATTVHPNTTGHRLMAQAVYAGKDGDLWRHPILDFPNITAGSTQTLTFKVYGARQDAGQTIEITPPSNWSAGVITESCTISGTDTLTLIVRDLTASDIDPPSGQWSCRVRRAN
ncbi:MAG: SGNH/GDSL hydrolase family protein [Opitutaceae bacterium]|jgi:lysophospholipase L1-like esterase